MSNTIAIENAKIGFKNFSGTEGAYNKEGDKNFVVFLDEDFAAKLSSDGLNIKYPKPRDTIDPDNDDRRPYLPVQIGAKFPPTIQLLTHTGDKTTSRRLTYDEFGMMDFIAYSSVDLIINLSHWTVNGESGIKAYLKSMYVNLEMDEFQIKYGLDPTL